MISEGSPLTLTMSGTPWRSDNTKIALQNYLGEPEELHTDYIYGLSEAIKDRVCRKPNLILIDNSKIEVREGNQTHKFCSIRHAVEADKLKYSKLITNKVALEYLIKCAHHELSRIRLESPDAAGLVVASSIEQANRISQYIKNKFNEHVTVVSYEHAGAHEKIRDFQKSKSRWIVSIGMVSEGTDIPRLQVCAYLSNIRTELYYRQVLGRILRIHKKFDEQCSLIAFAEPKITEYSERINQDLPSDSMKIKFFSEKAQVHSNSSNYRTDEFVDKGYIVDLKERENLIKSGLKGVSNEIYHSVELLFGKDYYRSRILSL